MVNNTDLFEKQLEIIEKEIVLLRKMHVKVHGKGTVKIDSYILEEFCTKFDKKFINSGSNYRKTWSSYI